MEDARVISVSQSEAEGWLCVQGQTWFYIEFQDTLEYIEKNLSKLNNK